MRAHKINKEIMKEIENNGFRNLTSEELFAISGGTTDPGDAVHDFGVLVGKIGGWIKNFITADRPNDHWIVDVDPKILFG